MIKIAKDLFSDMSKSEAISKMNAKNLQIPYGHIALI